jgi:hypothetical protein
MEIFCACNAPKAFFYKQLKNLQKQNNSDPRAVPVL